MPYHGFNSYFCIDASKFNMDFPPEPQEGICKGLRDIFIRIAHGSPAHHTVPFPFSLSSPVSDTPGFPISVTESTISQASHSYQACQTSKRFLNLQISTVSTTQCWLITA